MKLHVLAGPNIKAEPFVEEPKITKVTEFNEESFGKFVKDLHEMREARQTILPIHIDSYGGAVYTLLGMVNLLEAATETVLTYTGSKAMSCGSILLACGTPGYRFVAPHATVMIHSVSMFAMGKLGDVEISVEEGKRLNKLIFELLSTKAGKKGNYFKKFLKDRVDRDIFLTAQQTVELGIADRVGVPTVSVEVSQKFEVSV